MPANISYGNACSPRRPLPTVAKKGLISVLYNYSVVQFRGRPNPHDDPYRFDVWLTPSAAVLPSNPSLPLLIEPALLEFGRPVTAEELSPLW